MSEENQQENISITPRIEVAQQLQNQCCNDFEANHQQECEVFMRALDVLLPQSKKGLQIVPTSLYLDTSTTEEEMVNFIDSFNNHNHSMQFVVASLDKEIEVDMLVLSKEGMEHLKDYLNINGYTVEYIEDSFTLLVQWD